MLNVEDITRIVIEVIKVLEVMQGQQTQVPQPASTGVPDMIQAKVIGSVWSSHKIDELTGHKLMLLKELDNTSHTFVATDRVGAGLHDTVLVSFCKKYPIDAEIVAIIDSAHVQ